MLKDYNQKQRLKDSQYFFQPAYFNPVTSLDPSKYVVNNTSAFPFLFQNPFLSRSPPSDEKVVVLGSLPSYSSIM